MFVKVRHWTAVIATALVLTYVSISTLSEVRDFSLWAGSLEWLAVAALVCGLLLALVGGGNASSIVAASVLSAFLFAGVWHYILWSFLGEYISFFEVGLSNLFILQVLPRCALILIITAPLGLVGFVAATILLPDSYHL